MVPPFSSVCKVLLVSSKSFGALAFADESLQASILAFEVSEKLREEFTYKRSKEQLQAESKTLAEELINKAFALWQKTKKPYYAN